MTDRYDGPVDGLTRYLRRIREFPLLGKEQERALAERWRDTRDPEALRLLVNSHLRLVAKMAMANRGYGLPVSELISEGNIGLLQAVERFDPDRGFRLSTYARWWIRAAIQDYILRNWSLVKLGTTAAQKRLFFNLRRIKQRLEELEQ
ncbi:MAG TPA: sigma-70 family RNA polymerase sigma factor, partial [Kiloniellales bacterium]|nr:sigma-70 family RNA polymerase sigma factor [Kiloniellales bacterium]